VPGSLFEAVERNSEDEVPSLPGAVDALPLEPSMQQMRDLARVASDFAVDFVSRLPEMAAMDPEGASALASPFREPAPEAGRPLAALLAAVGAGAEKGINTAGPGYLGCIPAGGLFTAALAELISAAMNRYVTMWTVSPACAQIEAAVVRWFADLFALPAEARGVLTSGGSMSNLSAIVTARRARLPDDFLRGTLYVSDQTHASVAKAAMIAGFPRERVRTVPTTPELRMDLDATRALVRADRRAGLQPFCLVASAGTTNTGAVDPLDACADLAKEEDLWLHADAAYGGFFQLTERGRRKLRGLERADSTALDPHKGLFLPYGIGALLVRDGQRLREAHALGAEYLQDLGGEEAIPNFTDYSPELSRDFRGLRAWLPIQLHGLAAFRRALDEKLDLAEWAHQALVQVPGLEVPWAPELSAVAFRLRPAGGTSVDSDLDALNARLLERINASRRVFLSSTRVRGRFMIRLCVLSARTHRDRVEEAVEIVRRAAAELTGGPG
jgi:aromatic-L-amino-acid/L-tryptophan decarboxylase